jgi:hypothetical protein
MWIKKSAVHDIATPALRQKDLDTTDTYICRSANIAHNWHVQRASNE